MNTEKNSLDLEISALYVYTIWNVLTVITEEENNDRPTLTPAAYSVGAGKISTDHYSENVLVQTWAL